MKFYLIVAFLFMISAIQSVVAEETQNKQEEDSSWSEVGQSIKSTSGKAWGATKSTSSDAWEATKEGSSEAWEATKEGSGEAWDATKKFSNDTWEKISD